MIKCLAVLLGEARGDRDSSRRVSALTSMLGYFLFASDSSHSFEQETLRASKGEACFSHVFICFSTCLLAYIYIYI